MGRVSLAALCNAHGQDPSLTFSPVADTSDAPDASWWKMRVSVCGYSFEGEEWKDSRKKATSEAERVAFKALSKKWARHNPNHSPAARAVHSSQSSSNSWASNSNPETQRVSVPSVRSLQPEPTSFIKRIRTDESAPKAIVRDQSAETKAVEPQQVPNWTSSTTSSAFVPRQGRNYKSIICEMMPNYRQRTGKERRAVKLAVKRFLTQELQDQFSECVTACKGHNGLHQTYSVPANIAYKFEDWIFAELKRCFPDDVVRMTPSSKMANEDEEFKREMSVDEKTKDEVSEGGRDRDADRDRGRDKDGDDKDKVRFGKDRRSDDVKSLFVRGLAQGTRAEDLNSAFETYGKVRDVYIPKDYYSGGIKGFAYIQYESQAEADTAYDKIEYLTINGRRLTVEWASGDRKSICVIKTARAQVEAIAAVVAGAAEGVSKDIDHVTVVARAPEAVREIAVGGPDLAPHLVDAIDLTRGTEIPDGTETGGTETDDEFSKHWSGAGRIMDFAPRDV
ncbi:hypothetical protein CcCBS67573_g09275 [Chytriomyces confervae]|uniref:RRM domain-containing protein n=1 Tax=Chytriomyces confervae TaxID=246404 RepID=A0A507E260_9FUNG|nr:hypothetical protein CcCBS67573_g09275 [Chytriomyces confervae]